MSCQNKSVVGFDHDKYIRMQSEHIRERIGRFGGKLYLEFGGKLFDDFHASRVLPGFRPDSKVNMLLQLREQVEIVIAINAADIEKSKRRGDLDITYDMDVLRLIDAFRGIGLFVGSVVLTQYHQQVGAEIFQKRLERLGIRVYRHYMIPGYPSNIPLIVSDDGYGKNEYIETTRSLVIVTAPGPGSGKMATCLSQLYHDAKRGITSGYAKFETFPIWNIPLKHPVNLAYEAATADLNDVNMIDPFHLEKYGVTAVNYNRDVEVFPLLRAIFERIEGVSPYYSPTDMGVNMVGYCITDDAIVTKAARQEILRRYYTTACDIKTGMQDSNESIYKLDILLNQAEITTAERPAIQATLDKAKLTGEPAAAIQLTDGRIVTGKTSSLLGATAAMLLNALKVLGNIQDDMLLLSPIVIEPIQSLKTEHLGSINPRLHTNEILLALSICAATNPTAKLALDQLEKLRGCDAHASVLLSEVDRSTLRKLGIYLTCEPVYSTDRLYQP